MDQELKILSLSIYPYDEGVVVELNEEDAFLIPNPQGQRVLEQVTRVCLEEGVRSLRKIPPINVPE
jgi:hypothetical protein